MTIKNTVHILLNVTYFVLTHHKSLFIHCRAIFVLVYYAVSSLVINMVLEKYNI